METGTKCLDVMLDLEEVKDLRLLGESNAAHKWVFSGQITLPGESCGIDEVPEGLHTEYHPAHSSDPQVRMPCSLEDVYYF